MRSELLRFNGTVERDLAIDAWMKDERTFRRIGVHRTLLV